MIMSRRLVLVAQASHRQYSTVVAWYAASAPWLHHQQRDPSRGLDDVGQCGVANNHPSLVPAPRVVDTSSDVATIAAGARGSAAVTTSGDVYTWGANAGGSLGHGDEEQVGSPRRIEWLAHRAAITHVALGTSHSVMLDDTGQAWSCGVDLEVCRVCFLDVTMDVHDEGRTHNPLPSQPSQQHRASAARVLGCNMLLLRTSQGLRACMAQSANSACLP